MDKFILKLYSNEKSVFSINDLSLLFPKISPANLKSRVSYFARKGSIMRLRRGVYAKENYDPLEMATSIFSPSYVSFETILERGGVIFQQYKTIFVASYLSREIKVGAHTIDYRNIKAEVLTNPLGIKSDQIYPEATKERALLDTLYLFGDYHFDNLGSIDFEKCHEMIGIYKNKTMIRRLEKIEGGGRNG